MGLKGAVDTRGRNIEKEALRKKVIYSFA